VIIGAGVVGTSIAYHLSKHGVDAVLLDRGDIAGGTSSACDGHVLTIDKNPGYDSRLAQKSQAILHDLIQQLPLDAGYRNWGSVLAVEREEDMEAAERFAESKREHGTAIRLMDRAEMRADAPNLAEDIAGGVLCGSDSVVNPMALAFGLAEGARQNGVELQPFTEVSSIDLDEKGVCAVRTDRGTIFTRAAVCAAGVWSPRIAATVGIQLPIRPRKGHVLVAEQDRLPYWRNMLEFGYLMAKRGVPREVEPDMEQCGVAFVFERTVAGNFLLGSSREFVGFEPGVNPEVVRLMARRAERFFPCIADVHIIRVYTGFRPYTPDHRPIISPVEEAPGFFVAAGHEGNGIGLAAITGRLISDMVLGKEPIVDPSPLLLERFAAS